MNTQLIIPDEIKRELSVNPDGTCVISIRGLARLLEIKDSALHYHFKTAQFSRSKMAISLIEQGFNPLSFSEGIPEVAISIIILHYAIHGNKNVKQRATDILLAYSAIGIRTWIQHELGYNQSKQPKYNEQQLNDYINQQVESKLAIILNDVFKGGKHYIVFEDCGFVDDIARMTHFSQDCIVLVKALELIYKQIDWKHPLYTDWLDNDIVLFNITYMLLIAGNPYISRGTKCTYITELMTRCQPLTEMYYCLYNKRNKKWLTLEERNRLAKCVNHTVYETLERNIWTLREDMSFHPTMALSCVLPILFPDKDTTKINIDSIFANPINPDSILEANRELIYNQPKPLKDVSNLVKA